MNPSSSPSPPARDEMRLCPHCGRLTRHRVTRERVLAPVFWCLACFGVRVGDDEAPPPDPDSQAA